MVYFLVPIAGLLSIPVGGYGVAKLSNKAANACYTSNKPGTPKPPYPFPPAYMRFGGDGNEPDPRSVSTAAGMAVSAVVFVAALVAGRKHNPLVKMARGMNLGATVNATTGKMETTGHFFASNAPGVIGLVVNVSCAGVAAGAACAIVDP